MAELHHWFVLALRLAEGRKQHPSNAAFGEWVRNDPEVLRHNRGPLNHRDRAALVQFATRDPEQASEVIRKSRYSTPENLWRYELKYLPERKTTPAAPVRKTAEAAVRKTPTQAVRKTAPEPPEDDDDDLLPRAMDWRERRKTRLPPDLKTTIPVGVIQRRLQPLVDDLKAEGRKNVATMAPGTVLHRAALFQRQIDEWGQPDPHGLNGQPDPVRKTEGEAVVSVGELRRKLLPDVRALQRESRKKNMTGMSLDAVARLAARLQRQLDEWGTLRKTLR